MTWPKRRVRRPKPKPIIEVSEVYRDHELKCSREPSMAGEDLLFYSVFRESDGLEIASGFSYDTSHPRDFMKASLRFMVDEAIAHPERYDDDQDEG